MSRNLLSIICLILMLASVVCLFVPCWSYEREEGIVAVSVVDYILYPADHKELTKILRDYTDDKNLSTRTALPLFVLLIGGVAAFVAGAVKFRTVLPAVFAAVVGVFGLIVYTTNIAVMLGSMRIPQMIIYGVMCVVAVVQMVVCFRRKYLCVKA